MQLFRKLVRWTMTASLLATGIGLASAAQAAGLLRPADQSLPALSILDHDVQVVIQDGYAVTTVEQVFHNPHGQDLEAIYSFPVPDHAAVADFTYWIDGQPVTGEVIKKQEARTVYETEKQAGREAALAEQDGYKTFDVSVWPVRAGGEVRIRMAYMQPAAVDMGVGRYVYPLQDGGVDEERKAFWTAQETVERKFRFNMTLRSSVPVEAVRLPAHPGAVIGRSSDGHWTATVESGPGQAEGAQPGLAVQPAALNQDVVVYWRLPASQPARLDLVTHKPEADGRGTFMLTLTPGADLQPIREGRDWMLVLDKSGSMSGKWATLGQGVEKALERMRPEDRLRVILFDERAGELTRGWLPMTGPNKSRLLQDLAAIQPSHGTNLHAGLTLGLDGLDADRSSGLLLVTDGVANVGRTDTKDFLDLVRGRDARLFTIVMGNSANRPLLEGMTKVSGGSAVSVSTSDDVVGAVMTAAGRLGHEALHDVELSITGVRTADLAPRQIGSLYQGQQLVLFGHYWGGGRAEITVTAKVSGQPRRWTTTVELPAQSQGNPEIERLYGYAAIQDLRRQMDLLGQDADSVEAATDLALDYGLVTPWTSMVVVREEVFQAMALARRNRDRVAVERQAQEQRVAAPVVDRRADAAQPLFQGPAPSHAGGASGSIDPFAALMAAGLAGIALLRRKESDK